MKKPLKHPNTKRLRMVLQLVELMEFAQLKHLAYKSNKVIFRWVDEGHAALFDEHFAKVQSDIVAHCLENCGEHCKGDPRQCPLKKQLHALMKDKKEW